MSNRDADADYKAAYIAEYKAYLASGDSERAEAVAAVLRKLGHNIGTTVETKVVDTPAEKAVEDTPKRRPGRPVKAADPE